MKTLERLPAGARLVLFPDAAALAAHLEEKPSDRLVSKLPGARNAPGEIRALLVSYKTPEDKRLAEAEAALQELNLRRAYVRTFAKKTTASDEI